MSLKINKDNIFFILPESRYAVSDRIDGYMEEDFTLHITAKLVPDAITSNQSFIIARNGMHTGISVFKDDWGFYNIVFTYWFIDKDGNTKPKEIIRKLTDSEIETFNKYTMICDHYVERKIFCYFNGELIGSIDYEKDDKIPYKEAFYWFGCGSMIAPDEHKAIGEFEYELAFLLNKKLSIEETEDIINNYGTKYSHTVFNDLKKLNYDYPLRPHFAFLCDFNHYNRYKVWDISFSGNYPQFYIEHNIYF